MAKLFEKKDYRELFGDDLLEDDFVEEAGNLEVQEHVEAQEVLSAEETTALEEATEFDSVTDETIEFDAVTDETIEMDAVTDETILLNDLFLDDVEAVCEDETEELFEDETEELFEDSVVVAKAAEAVDDDDYDDFEGFSLAAFFGNMFEGSIIDKIVMGTGIVIALCVLCVCGVMLFGGNSSSVSASVSFDTVGVSLKDIEVIGQDGLLAMTDNMSGTTVGDTDTDVSYDEEDLSSSIYVDMTFTSIQKDLKIKFINYSTEKLIANVPFEVLVEDPDGNVSTWVDDDMDGIIYEKDITDGDYTITLIDLEDEAYDRYIFNTAQTYTTTVKKDIVYEQVDVEDEIKDESEVDVENEEVEQTVGDVESTVEDTVVWVESTKTYIGDTYTEISKSDIDYTSASIMDMIFLRTASSASDGSTVETDSSESTESSEAEKTYSNISLSLTGSQSVASGTATTITATASGATSGETLTYTWSYTGDTSSFTVVENGSSVTVTPNTNTSSATLTVSVTVAYQNSDAASSTAATASTKVTGEALTYGDITVSLANKTITAGSSETITATVTSDSGKDLTYEWSSGDSYFTVSGSDASATVTASSSAGGQTLSLTLKVYYTNNTSKYTSITVTITGEAITEVALQTSDGEDVYVLDGSDYRTATTSDYSSYSKFYIKNTGYKYTGWQTIDGKVYYYDSNGNYVTGQQVIQGATYSFNSDGSLQSGSGVLGIDVSRYNTVLDWTAVKNAGVNFVIIRTGYRGYGSGVLVEDSSFRSHIAGATAAGLDIGVYFFSQAIDEVEAVEEASMVISQVQGYSLSYPIYIDVEYSNTSHTGRADSLSVAQRTAVVNAFCKTIQNSGYRAGVYANKSWLETMLDVSQLGAYSIWLAQYASTPTYTGHYDMWQYSQTGSINGVSGNVDLNLSY